jgi:hypothetical protein
MASAPTTHIDVLLALSASYLQTGGSWSSFGWLGPLYVMSGNT